MNGKPKDMSVEFAIRVLKSAKVEPIKNIPGNPIKYRYQNQTFYDIARNMAIKALQTSEARKPEAMRVSQNSPYRILYKCPCCGTPFAALEDRMLFCNTCGVKVDWNVTRDFPTEDADPIETINNPDRERQLIKYVNALNGFTRK